MILLGVTAILEFSFICLKAGYAFLFSPAGLVSVSVWVAPTKKSEPPTTYNPIP
jgi:hypothetical protein